MLVSSGMNSVPQFLAVNTLVLSTTSQVTFLESTWALIFEFSVGPSCNTFAPDCAANGSIAAFACPSWKMPPYDTNVRVSALERPP